MDKKVLIRNTIILLLLFALVFLSQQAFFISMGKVVVGQAGTYEGKAVDWFKAKVYPIIYKEAESRGDALQEEVTKQKNNFMQSAWENVKKFLAEKLYKFSGTKVE